jgi:hypothetical protein
MLRNEILLKIYARPTCQQRQVEAVTPQAQGTSAEELAYRQAGNSEKRDQS